MTSAMIGRVTDCVLLWYRTPAASVAHLLPAGLEPVTRGPWAFWNIALCGLGDVRPEGVPASCGIGYRRVAYHLLVQAMDDRAELLRGLHFVRSDIDQAAVDGLGRRLADQRPHGAVVTAEVSDAAVSCRVTGTAWGEGEALVRVEAGDFARPADSCFPSGLDAAEALAHPPLALAVEGGDLRLTRTRRDAGAWIETPVRVVESRFDFLHAIGQRDLVLERATRAAPIDCRWAFGDRRRLLAGGPLQHTDLPRRRERPLPLALTPSAAK